MSVDTLESPKIDKNLIADDFLAAYQGKIPNEQLERAVEKIRTTQARYPISNGSILSTLFYVRITCNISPGGKQYGFVGNGGGLFTIGGGALLGDIYTDDYVRLIKDTVSFQVNATPVYVNVNFFDRGSNLLGNLQVGAVSIVVGTGGGSGSWT